MVTKGSQDASPIDLSNPIIASLEERIETLEGKMDYRDKCLNEYDQWLNEHEQQLANKDAILAKTTDDLDMLHEM